MEIARERDHIPHMTETESIWAGPELPTVNLGLTSCDQLCDTTEPNSQTVVAFTVLIHFNCQDLLLSQFAFDTSPPKSPRSTNGKS